MASNEKNSLLKKAAFSRLFVIQEALVLGFFSLISSMYS